MKTVSYIVSSVRLALVCIGLVYLVTYGTTTALGVAPTPSAHVKAICWEGGR